MDATAMERLEATTSHLFRPKGDKDRRRGDVIFVDVEERGKETPRCCSVSVTQSRGKRNCRLMTSSGNENATPHWPDLPPSLGLFSLSLPKLLPVVKDDGEKRSLRLMGLVSKRKNPF